MNFNVGDRVNYIGNVYSIKNPRGVITKIYHSNIIAIDVLFEGYDQPLYCYESELKATTISFNIFREFENKVRTRSDISEPYSFMAGWYESLIQHLYTIGSDKVKDEIIRSLERI